MPLSSVVQGKQSLLCPVLEQINFSGAVRELCELCGLLFLSAVRFMAEFLSLFLIISLVSLAVTACDS